MWNRFIILFLFINLHMVVVAQTENTPKRKSFFLGRHPDYHRFYVGIRFPQTYYFKSDLHLCGKVQQSDLSFANFDVTIADIRCHDDGFVYGALFRTILKGAVAPPYVIAFGYKFKNSNFGIAGRVIHFKQFMTHGQSNRINGTVGSDTYHNYYGSAPFLLNYENTDGHNICTIGPEFTYTLVRSKNTNHWLDVTGMLGACISYPRTDATVMTPDSTIVRRNNNYRVSGGGIYFESGFMGTVCNFLTFMLECNFTIIRNSNMNIINNGISNLHGSQTISAFSWSSGIALTVPVKPFKKIRAEKTASKGKKT